MANWSVSFPKKCGAYAYSYTLFHTYVFVDDIIKRISYAIRSKDAGENCFIDKKMLSLKSIYSFLENYILNKSIDSNLLDYKENDYISGYPDIDLKNIKLTPHEKSLITVIDKVMG